MSNPFTTEQFINSAKSKFSNKFDYSQVNYRNANTKVKIICPIHGEFLATPFNHLKSLHGCRSCGTMAMAKQQKDLTKEKFNKLIEEDTRYDYSLVKFDLITDKISVVCKDHGIFNVTVDHYLRGVRCKKCADQNKTGGYNDQWFEYDSTRRDLPGLLYVLEMFSESEKFIKIGITKNSVKQRYRGSVYSFNVLKTHYSTLYDCYLLESSLKEKFIQYRYVNSKKIYLTESFKYEVKDSIIDSISN